MSDTPPSLISKSYDEFNEKTTTQMINEFATSMSIFRFKYRHVKTKDFDSALLDLRVQTLDWMFVQKVIINCDQENIHLDYEQTESDTSWGGLNGDTLYCNEWGYFQIDKATVEKICKANVIKMRMNGQSSYESIEQEDASLFQIYTRQWYNQFYDSSMYVESLAVKTTGGCFIATAAMGNYNHPKVVGLRNFRDQYLEESEFGRNVIKKYYQHGPKPAGFIEKSNLLRRITYYLLVEPAYIVSQFLLRNK